MYGNPYIDKAVKKFYRVIVVSRTIFMGLLNKSNTESNEKLLYRKWVKANKNREDLTQYITQIKLSSSEEWILIETDESLALLNAESGVGKELWEELLKFNGKGKALTIFPDKGKLGFDLDFDPNKEVYYSWDDDILTIGAKKQKTSGIKSKISWNLIASESTSEQKPMKPKSSQKKGKNTEVFDSQDLEISSQPLMISPEETSSSTGIACGDIVTPQTTP